MNPEILAKYADVIVRCGVAVYEGQSVVIRTEPGQRMFANALARRAYEVGARYVYTQYGDPALDRIRLETSKDEHLDGVPSFVQPTFKAYIDENWAAIALVGPEDPDVLEGVDSARLGRARKAASIAAQDYLTAASANAISWNVCLFPTRRWAAKVLGDDADWEARIWRELLPILRLDHADPAAAWLAHDKELKRRADHMNAIRYDTIRFVGPGTDLTIGMGTDRLFIGGSGLAKDGRRFFANIPTEEIFSAPDLRRVDGRVRCTRPVEVMGSNVDGVWFRFEKGRVVEAGAEKNASVLEQFLQIEEAGRYLGEIALVGTDSPIYSSGRVFHNILFDENATSHIALGNGYAKCLEGGTELSKDELRARGCNVSLVHLDFMIGGADVSVLGSTRDCPEETIIRDGRFVI